MRSWVREMRVDGFRFDLVSVSYRRARSRSVSAAPRRVIDSIPAVFGVTTDPFIGRSM